MVAYDRIDELKKKLDGLQLELKALRMKDSFGKNAFDLCLVPNVVIPPKFKVPNFEKYKGKTSPMVHLEMYVRKMSAYVDNDELLIHCFQDSLTGAAMLWYMGLEKADIKTFIDLCKAFILRYNYNLYLPLDGDELQTMTRNDNVQLWRDCAAQVRPPLEEMMTTGMLIRKGVRKRRLGKESVPTNSSEGKDHEMSRVKSQLQHKYLVYYPVAAVRPITNVVQNLVYQPHFQRYQQPPRQQVPRTHIDLIPMKYADLFPRLLERKLIYTKAPPLVTVKLTAWYRPDLFCAFHQGASSHDIEHYFSFQKVVQKLV